MIFTNSAFLFICENMRPIINKRNLGFAVIILVHLKKSLIIVYYVLVDKKYVSDALILN